MSKEHPTPWTFHAVDVCDDQPILDANGNEVLVRDSGVYPPDLDTCREIVDAVNERDRLRDIVRRMADTLEHVSNEHRFDFYELVREARAAIGEGDRK